MRSALLAVGSAMLASGLVMHVMLSEKDSGRSMLVKQGAILTVKLPVYGSERWKLVELPSGLEQFGKDGIEKTPIPELATHVWRFRINRLKTGMLSLRNGKKTFSVWLLPFGNLPGIRRPPSEGDKAPGEEASR